MSGNKFKAPINSEPSVEPKLDRRPSLQKKVNSSVSETILYGGEKLSKGEKLISALGTIEELIAYLGVIKAEHFDTNGTATELKFSATSSSKLFLFARLTRTQEILLDIMRSLGTSRKIPGRFENSRFDLADKYVAELEKELSTLNIDAVQSKTFDKPLQLLPGSSVLEAKLFYARAICRRAERQIISSKSAQNGLVVEDGCLHFLNRLGDYLLSLAVHSLLLLSKEPMKKINSVV